MRDTVNQFPKEYKRVNELALIVLEKVLTYIPWVNSLEKSVQERIEVIRRDRWVLLFNQGRMLRWHNWNERYLNWNDRSYNDFYLGKKRKL